MTAIVRKAARSRVGADRRSFEMQLWQRLLFPCMTQVARQLATLLSIPAPMASVGSLQHSPYTFAITFD